MIASSRYPRTPALPSLTIPTGRGSHRSFACIDASVAHPPEFPRGRSRHGKG